MGTISCLSPTLLMPSLRRASHCETCRLLRQHAVSDIHAPPSTLLKTPFEKDFLHLYSWLQIKRTLLLYFIYLYIVVVMCVNACVHECVCVRWWVICDCVCMCVHPQRYFNFFRILNKHAAAAAASLKRCLPVGFGLDGWRCWWWRGRGGLWPWLWGGEAAHGQGPRRTHWRLALEDFWTTTLLHQNPANPGSLLQLPTQITQLASLSSPPWLVLPSIVFLFCWSKSRFICYLAAFSLLTYVSLMMFFYLFSRGFCVLTYPTAFLSFKSLHFKCSKEVFSGFNLKKANKNGFGRYVSQNTITVVCFL